MEEAARDPFSTLLRREVRTHFIICFVAFLVLAASRYAGLRLAGPDAVLLSPTPLGLLGDFGTAVLMLTFFRVLYGIPLWFVRPLIRVIASHVLFTFIFGSLFFMQMAKAIGAEVEPGAIRVHYPYPRSSRLLPVRDLGDVRVHETSAVSAVEFPDASIKFTPVFHFDAAGQVRMRKLFDTLATVTSQAKPPTTIWPDHGH